MLNWKDFPLGFPRSVRSGSILYSGPMVNSPSPSAPGFSVSASAALAEPARASRAMRLIVPSNRAESRIIGVFDMYVVKAFGGQAHKRKNPQITFFRFPAPPGQFGRRGRKFPARRRLCRLTARDAWRRSLGFGPSKGDCAVTAPLAFRIEPEPFDRLACSVDEDHLGCRLIRLGTDLAFGIGTQRRKIDD